MRIQTIYYVTFGLILAFGGVLGFNPAAQASPFYQGPQKCAECHKAESDVWSQTKHFKSFAEIHRKPEVKAIITAAGGDANMRRNDTCVNCHYTMSQADADAKPAASAGPSCESCHGASSDWFAIHNDFGGPSAKKETETAAHKADRIQKAVAAGMIWPETMLYDVATNCLACHSMARPGVAPDTLAKMIDAGHPSGSSFELVAYSQGTVRHRFYPPDVTVNAPTSPADLARIFVTGHAAALVQVTAQAGKVSNAKYNDNLKKIETDARAALDSIKGSVPEAGALLAQPNDANARKLIAAIAGKDLSAQVGSKLPAASSYK